MLSSSTTQTGSGWLSVMQRKISAFSRCAIWARFISVMSVLTSATPPSGRGWLVSSFQRPSMVCASTGSASPCLHSIAACCANSSVGSTARLSKRSKRGRILAIAATRSIFGRSPRASAFPPRNLGTGVDKHVARRRTARNLYGLELPDRRFASQPLLKPGCNSMPVDHPAFLSRLRDFGASIAALCFGMRSKSCPVCFNCFNAGSAFRRSRQQMKQFSGGAEKQRKRDDG